jgi:hypothetical protein
MDRRTIESKAGWLMLRDNRAEMEDARVDYVQAARCRVCNTRNRDLAETVEVRTRIDEVLLRGGSYRSALVAVEHLVAEWSNPERPTYAAVRNHAKKHLRVEEVMTRMVMEREARAEGIDPEDEEGSILTPAGVLALIQERGFRNLQDADIKPTVAETMTAARSLSAIDSERLRMQLRQALDANSALMAIIREWAPDADIDPALGTRSSSSRVVVVPKAEVSGPKQLDAGTEAGCEICGRKTKSARGLKVHSARMHGDVSRTTT